MSNQVENFAIQDKITITRTSQGTGNTDGLTEAQREELRKKQLTGMGITEEQSQHALENGLTQLHG